MVGWLKLIPQISPISLWVENLTEVGGVLGCMGFQITLSSPSTPSAPSSPFTKAKCLFVRFVRFVVFNQPQICTNFHELFFIVIFHIFVVGEKNRVHWLVHPMILER